MKGDFKKAKEISKETKIKVWERQRGRSLFAPYKPITIDMCCCHYVSRTGNDRHGKSGSAGVGYEWNIFGCYQTPWDNEHDLFDDGKKIGNLTNDEAVSVVENHLKFNYLNWERDKCRFHKGWSEEDYMITRSNIWKR